LLFFESQFTHHYFHCFFVFAVSIHVSPLILVRSWNDNILHNIDAPVAYSAMRNIIANAFSLTSDQSLHFWLHYLTDPSAPLQSRKKITDQITYQQFLNRYSLFPGSDQLILYVRDNHSSSSPHKEPVFLRINTESANETKSSSNHLSPSSSPKDSVGRRMEVKKQCLIRDGEGFLGEKVACLFCGDKMVVKYEKGPASPTYNGEVAHIVSFSEKDREGLSIPECLQYFVIGGLGGKSGVDVVENVIYLCCNCHKLFGSGQVWGEIRSASSPHILLHAESIARQENHGKLLDGKIVKIPTNPYKRRMFPSDEIWAWNQLWAEKRRIRKENSFVKFSSSSIADNSGLTQGLASLKLSDQSTTINSIAKAVKSSKKKEKLTMESSVHNYAVLRRKVVTLKEEKEAKESKLKVTVKKPTERKE
jgi:hypothetical protein